jgi:AraC family transcriptional regulator
MIPFSPGRFYFWGERALYLGPGTPATVHAHHAVQVCIPLSGTVRLRSGPRARWRHYAGAVIPSNQPHESDVAVPLIAAIWLEPDTAEAQCVAHGSRELPIVSIEPSKLGAIVPRLHECRDAQHAAVLVDDVMRILAPTPRPDPSIEPRVARARAILGSAPDRRLPLAEVAARVALSPSRLAHLLRAEMGMPARRYLLWLRLRDAVGALTYGGSITAAAHAAGFADAAHLTRTFRRMLGFTPSAALRVSKFVQDTPASHR